MRFKKILRSPTSTNHSLNARSPLGNAERSFAVFRSLLRMPFRHPGYAELSRLYRLPLQTPAPLLPQWPARTCVQDAL